MNQNADQVRTTYDEVASEYATRISDELAGKPLDRALLDVFAQHVGSGPRVCDAGCGPGQIARYLHDRGVNVYGVDISPNMVAEARRLHPEIEFRVGSLVEPLDAPDSLAGILSFYSLIHLPRERVTPALEEMRTALRPGGLLFLAFHIGSEVVHLEEWWGHSVVIDFILFEIEEMKTYLAQAGYELEWVIERAPYAGLEHPSRRAYILARKPD